MTPGRLLGRVGIAALLVAAWGSGACVIELDTHSGLDRVDAGPDVSDGSNERPDAGPLSPDADVPIELPEIDFADYHSQEEIAAYLRAVADAAPHLVSFEVLGESQDGREIALVVIDATGSADAPAVYANGTHHGDEKTSTESVLALVDHLLRHRDEPDIAAILASYAIYVQPLVNPDGHANDERGDIYGRDPNRDYLIPGMSESEAFRLVETRVVRDLHERVGFRASLAFHAGVTGILWPWGFTYDETDDHDLFHTLAKECADAMGFDRYYQSVELFPAEGEYSDFAYMADDTLSITVEVSEAKTPPASQLAPIVDRSLRGTVAYLAAVRSWDAGELPVQPELSVHFGADGPIEIVDGQKLE